MEITRQVLRDMGADIDVALALISKKHGLLLTRGNARFNSQSATFKIEAAVASAAAVAAVGADAGGETTKNIKAAEDYKRSCMLYGMKAEWLGKAFSWNGKVMSIVGLLPNKRVNNVLVRGQKGGQYIMSPEEVIPCFR